jgi:SAM-dependent methyltransferase
MSVFSENYSKIYNILYSNKNYKLEVSYIIKLLKKFNIKKNKILDLGCGSGKHLSQFVKKNYKVIGVEKNENMINQANKNVKKYIVKSSIENLRLKKKYYIVLSLFNVIGYFNSDRALNKFFKTASYHLKKGGIFIFDFWFSPSVKYIKPNKRSKYFYHKNFYIKKISRPKIMPNNIINVKFDFSYKINKKKILNALNKFRSAKEEGQEKGGSRKQNTKRDVQLYPNNNFSFSENHKIRHFSIKELVFYANKFGMNYISSYAMLKNILPSKKYWSSCIIFQKI